MIETSLLAESGTLIAIAIGGTQLIKQIAIIQPRFLPLISLLLAIVFAQVIFGVSSESFIIGFISGLSGSGLYDQKHILKALKEKTDEQPS